MLGVAVTTRHQQVAALDSTGKTARQTGAVLGMAREAVWQERHRRKLRDATAAKDGRPAAAAAEVSRLIATGVDRTEAFAQVARNMGVGVHTVRNYCNLLDGRPRRNYTHSESSAPRPKCSGCALTLFSPEELARGTCNNCLPASATELLGRCDEPVGVMCLPR